MTKFSTQNMVRVTNNIVVLYGSTNVTLIKAADKLFLIDTASTEQDGIDILQAAKELFGQTKLTAIINTHSHADHCGGNAYIVKETNCEVWANKAEKASIENPVFENAVMWGGKVPVELQHGFFEAQAVDVSRTIADGEVIFDEGDVNAYALSLPGHYIDQTGIVISDREAGKSVFCTGDALFGRFRMGKYWIPYTYDIGQFKDSLHKICSVSADYYLPSHGELVEDAETLAELNEFAIIETEQAILKFLEEKSMTAEEILSKVADINGIPMKIGQYALISCTIRSFLSYLEECGKIEFFFKNNFMLWRRKR